MGKHIFDFDDGGLLFTLGDGLAIDQNGNTFMKVSDDFAVNLETNDLHYTSGWDSDFLSGDDD